MANPAVAARREKEQHPERYCPSPKCLWKIVTRTGANPCRKHPVAPTTPTVEPKATCNECFADVQSRVEVRTSESRLVVCGACAVRLASECAANGVECRVSVFLARPFSPWVASDGSYWRNESDCRTRQRDLDAKAEQYAERVRRAIAEQLPREVSEVAA